MQIRKRLATWADIVPVSENDGTRVPLSVRRGGRMGRRNPLPPRLCFFKSERRDD